MSKCKECEGTGRADGAPDSPKCFFCYCDDCTFAPCECGIKCRFCKKEVYSFGEKESRMCSACFGLE